MTPAHPHQGKYGSCLCLSNELFASFHSSASKERGKFLDVLRCGHEDYVLNEAAWAYLDKQGLPAKVVRQLREQSPRVFVDAATWQQYLDGLDLAASNRETVTEAALLGSAVAHGVSVDLGVVSDGGRQYHVFVHGLCWIHQERNLAKLVPCGVEQSQAHQEVLGAIWQLYADLRAYRVTPLPEQAELLRFRFDEIVGRSTCFPELNAALVRMAGQKADLLRVLERPDLPLHTNTVERDFRDWATRARSAARGAKGAGVVGTRL